MELTVAAKKWQEVLSEFDRQGLTRREFCQARGIKVSTFSYWRTRFRKIEKEQSGVVRIARVEQAVAPIRICVGEQVVVELDGYAGEQQLRRVLKAAAQA